jgi:hypothetical protein
MRMKIFCAAVLAAIFGVISPASADILTITYTGTVIDSHDVAGVFGPPGSNFNGDDFNLVFTFNTLGAPVLMSNSSGYVIGGPGIGSAVLNIININGVHTLFFAGTFQSQDGAFTASSPSIVANQEIASDNFGTTGIFPFDSINMGGGLRTGSIFAQYSLTKIPGGDNVGGGPFELGVCNLSIPLCSDTVNGDLVASFVSFNDASISNAVPELSTWAMMLIGFAGIGFMAYRRQRRALATA